MLLYFCLCTDYNFSSACVIRTSYTASAHNCCTCRKIRSLNMLHKLLNSYVGIINLRNCTVKHLRQVMRRYICSHTYCNTAASVYEQCGYSGRKNCRLFSFFVKVWRKINRVLFNIFKENIGKLTHSRFCITVCSRRVTVNTTEVTVTVNKRVSHREILRKSYHCIVNRGITVGMIPTDYITYGSCRFEKRFVTCKIFLIH